MNKMSQLTAKAKTRVKIRAVNMTMVAMRRVLANILWHCFTGPIRKHVLMPTMDTRERDHFLLIQYSWGRKGNCN